MVLATIVTGAKSEVIEGGTLGATVLVSLAAAACSLLWERAR
jgi:hypothetical protein